jgi:hypothetical protein
MTKRHVKPMGEKEAAMLEEAADDVTHLIAEGATPTNAIVKVATAAELTKHQTNLLIYAYTNGMAAEKRAEAGGPFERLGEYPLPDVPEVHRLVFGEPEEKTALYNGLFSNPNPETKTASASNILPYGMQTFDVDITNLDKEVVRELFGFGAKTASERDEEEGQKSNCITMTRTTISYGKLPCGDEDCKEAKDDGHYHKIPTSIDDFMEQGMRPIAPDILNDFMSTLTGMVNEKRGEMIAANSEADDAYVIANSKIIDLASKLNNSIISPETKAAGLASIKAFYPDIADIIAPTATEVNGRLIKAAGLSNPLAISAKHTWVAEAKEVYNELEKVAELTITAQQKTAEYEGLWQLYTKHREEVQQKSAGTVGGYLLGQLTSAVGKRMENATTPEEAETQKRKQRESLLSELDDRLNSVQRDDIGVLSNVNDFAVNDEILKAYPKEDLLNKYTELLRVSPSAMRRKATARAMLQQQMTQGRFAPTELLPAMQINKLDPHKSSLREFRDDDSDDDE